MTKAYNMDCTEYMKSCKDNQFDLSIPDPPYGIGEDGGNKKRNRGYNRVVIHEKKEWDKKPSPEYFAELFRVSKHQIIFGANYFTFNIPPSMGWIFWDKNIGGDYSDGELIFTSFEKALRKIKISQFHKLRGGHDRIHPTQKPVALYKWILTNYAQPGWKIFDSHLGSGSSRIAAHDLGFDFVGCELDQDYFEAQEKRFRDYIAQGDLFQPEEYQDIIYNKRTEELFEL